MRAARRVPSDVIERDRRSASTGREDMLVEYPDREAEPLRDGLKRLPIASGAAEAALDAATGRTRWTLVPGLVGVSDFGLTGLMTLVSLGIVSVPFYRGLAAVPARARGDAAHAASAARSAPWAARAASAANRSRC